MATLYTDIAAVQLAPTPITMLDTLDATPTTRILTPVYTMTGTEAANDVIRVCKVPNGTKVICRSSGTANTATASVATITVGDDGLGGTLDADRYSTALDVAAAGVDSFTGGAAATVPYVSSAEGWITATFATLTTPNDTGVIQFFITVNQVT
jgi:hypothetical protein